MADPSLDSDHRLRRCRRFAGAMLCCMLAPALLQAAAEIRATGGIETARELLRLAPILTDASFASSREAFEERLESRSLIVRWARRLHAPLVDELLARGNAKVVFGRENWLFYRQAVDYVTGPPIASQRARRLLATPATGGDPLTAIVDFHRQLRTAGVELLLVPVPVKPTLYPERLWPGADPHGLPTNRGFSAFVAALERAGVQVIDLAPALLRAKREGLGLFLPRDTHWTPEAMALAARTVATKVEALPFWPTLAAAAEPFDHRQIAFAGHGDLYGMLAYAAWGRRARPMRFVLEQVIATPRGQGPRDESSPVLLLGDSFTNVFSSGTLALGHSGGFGEQLAARLGLPLDVIAMPAGGANRSREALALRPQPLRGKRLVIWQFTQRDLVFAAGGWALTPLAETAASPDGGAVGERSYEVLAWLEKTTRLPRRMDYADC